MKLCPALKLCPRLLPRLWWTLLVLALAASGSSGQANGEDPLPSWQDGPAKKAILAFVSDVTTIGSPDYVPVEERITTFDNDGTLWTEQPMYTQFVFAVDRVKALAPEHPEWKQTQPFKAVLEGDSQTFLASGERGVLQLIMATHTGMTSDEFALIVKDWIKTAQHPRFHRPYTQCVYQPMLELLSYLRRNAFATYIVSGGGVEFLRPWTQPVYGVPPEWVIGSSVKTKFEIRAGQPVLLRMPEVDFVDDKAGKPVAIDKFIGRRPLAAFGNSDGDQQMLEWTAAGKGPRLMVLIHHTDGDREYAYDRNSMVGTLDHALEEANARGWTVVDMKQDWKAIFPRVQGGP